MSQQTVFNFDIDSARNREPAPVRIDTRAEAARKIAPLKSSMQRQIMDFVANCGSRGATDFEIHTALRMQSDTARVRRGELVKAGALVASGYTRPSPGGNPVTVWIAAG